MPTTPTQAHRTGYLTTALGKDKLLLLRATVTEGLSELFEIQVDALSTELIASFNTAIGEKSCLVINGNDGKPRYFNGIMTAAQWTGTYRSHYSYRITIRPWFWLLSRVSNCRIFKDKTVDAIITEVFGGHSEIAKFRPSLDASYDQIPYCVQYRETDFDFVCRLMEEFGIYYFFEHSESQHVLALVDSKSAHKPKEGLATVGYGTFEGGQRRLAESYWAWTAERTFNSGKVVYNDYDFKSPSTKLISKAEGGGGYKNDKLEVYDYPGRYKTAAIGDKLAQVRLESIQARDNRCYAAGDSVFSMPGALVNLSGHKSKELNCAYLIVRAVHQYSGVEYSSVGPVVDDEIYSGRYELLPTKIPFRAPQLTSRPVVHGPQTAVVCGNGEIDVDSDGCIMVQFHWDRDKVQSRRVRVAQVWSGKAWGGIYIPRVGQEVVVQFIEGDPDRPMVIGTVYNGEHALPYDMEKEYTIAGVKSDSTLGSGGYNEFIFDDKKGSELVRLHAQKDLSSVIENDEKRDVKHDVTRHVGNSETVQIDNTLKITANQMIELTVGKSKITMDPASITIKSSLIKIEAEVSLIENSPLTMVEGKTTLILKGGVVLIN
jgi:type VI secretion system secreted protein VgrG